MLLVFRYRVKSLTGLLKAQARACNFVWNFCNDTQKQALKWNKRWPSGFDLNRLTAGSSKELALHAGTINAVCEQCAKSRRQKQLPFLRWRGRRSLGWVPLKGRDLKREGNAFRFAGNTFRVFNSRPLPQGKIKDGTSFSCDARGHWFLNIVECRMIVISTQPEISSSVRDIERLLRESPSFKGGEDVKDYTSAIGLMGLSRPRSIRSGATTSMNS